MEIREPLGVIAIVCGHGQKDNHPLLSFVLHLTSAIAFGNSVIIVPDEKFPLPALDLYEIFDTSDMPGGYFTCKNIISALE
jgi:aldehyde dehydrogenase (NAD+)